MGPRFYIYTFIFLLFFIINTIRRVHAFRSAHKKIESPTIVQRVGYNIMFIPTTVLILLTIFTLFAEDDLEFLIVCSIMTVVFLIITYFTRRKFKNLYRETESYFFLDGQYMSFQVEYDDIIDWMPFSKQIGVRDRTIPNSSYICVNLRFSDPDILLRKLTEMTFAGAFKDTDNSTPEDPNREQELIDFLQKNGYGHIVEEVMQEVSLNE